MVMTDNNIKNFVVPNSDEENVKLVKDLVKQMKLEKCNVSDGRTRSKALCDLQNVCNIIAIVKENLASTESESQGEAIAPGAIIPLASLKVLKECVVKLLLNV